MTFRIAVPKAPGIVGFMTEQVTPIGCTVTKPHSLIAGGLVVVVVAKRLDDGVVVGVTDGGVGVFVGVWVWVIVGVLVLVGVDVFVGVLVGVIVLVGVLDGVAVGVRN